VPKYRLAIGARAYPESGRTRTVRLVKLMGALVVGAGAVLSAVGLLWLLLAIVGKEWDFCPSGGCIAGEIAGAAIAAVAALLAVLGRRLARRG
jgi:hypothetical protein